MFFSMFNAFKKACINIFLILNSNKCIELEVDFKHLILEIFDFNFFLLLLLYNISYVKYVIFLELRYTLTIIIILKSLVIKYAHLSIFICLLLQFVSKINLLHVLVFQTF